MRRRMTQWMKWSVAVVVGCAAAQADDAAALLRQVQHDLAVPGAASTKPVNATGEADTAQLIESERQAEVELALGAVRLGLLKARVRMAQGKPAEALAVANAAMKNVDRLASPKDRADLTQSLGRIIADARAVLAAGRKVPGATAPILASDMGNGPAESGPGAANDPTSPDQEEAQPSADAAPAEPPATAEIHVIVYDETWPPDRAPIKIRDTFGLSEPFERDRVVAAYQDEAVSRMGEEPDVWGRVLIYSLDWPAIWQGREDRDDGLIWRGPDFVDEDGQTKYTAIYDIAGLTMDVRPFNNPPQLDLNEILQNGADREALRRGSEIFNGYAEDLAAGIPLLQFFGGVDETHQPPAGHDRGYEDLMRMVREVVETHNRGAGG